MKTTTIIPNVLPSQNDRTGYKKYTILNIKGTYYNHAVFSVLKGESARQVFQGPLVEGPWASTFGLCSMLVAHDNSAELAEEASRTIEVQSGDIIKVEGTFYEVEVYRREYIRLIKR